MPVYVFTFHAYRSWNADHPRGFVQKPARLQAPNPSLARAYDRAAAAPPAGFDAGTQRLLLQFFHDACQRRAWRLYGYAGEPTHLHLLIGWQDATSFEEVGRKLKNLASWRLNKGEKRRWFSRGFSRRRVTQREHFNHLVHNYLPKHRGVVWTCLQAPPPPPPEPPERPELPEPPEPPAAAGGS